MLLTDVAISLDINVVKKEPENNWKYRDLL
jgi:hypothetical protein